MSIDYLNIVKIDYKDDILNQRTHMLLRYRVLGINTESKPHFYSID